MVGPNQNTMKPYRDWHPLMSTFSNGDLLPPPPVPQNIRRHPVPPYMVASSMRFLNIRKNHMNKISRGLIHVHKNGLRTRMPTCPPNATCVGVDDIGEYMYNQARRCKYLSDKAYKLKESSLANRTNDTPTAKSTDEMPDVGKLNIDLQISPPHIKINQEICWDPLVCMECPEIFNTLPSNYKDNTVARVPY